MSLFRVLIFLQFFVVIFMYLSISSTVNGNAVSDVTQRWVDPIHLPYGPTSLVAALARSSRKHVRRLPPKMPVAVEGVVYCISCKHKGANTFKRAFPLPGVGVRMLCSYKKGRPRVVGATTDKSGYFFIPPTHKVSSYGAQKRCKVYLNSPPLHKTCRFPTNVNWGVSGANLRFPDPPPPPLDYYALYTVGPLAYSPTSCHK